MTKKLIAAASIALLALTGCSTATVEKPATQQETAAEAEAPEVVEQESQFTAGQTNAIKKAEAYLNTAPFSRTGLIDQLVFEGFDQADSEFAVDNITVDWNEQAAKKATAYIDMTGFSRDGLIDQLLFEGYTQEQAEHGAAAVGY